MIKRIKALSIAGVAAGVAVIACFALPSSASASATNRLTPYLTPQAKQTCDAIGYTTRLSYPLYKCFVENKDPGYGEEYTGNYCVQRIIIPPVVIPAVRGIGYYYAKATDLGIYEGCNIGWYQLGGN